ncbi:MAG: DedA family protein [Propionibacteriaceae bacterium]
MNLLNSLLLVPLLIPDWLDPQRIIEATGPWALPVVALIIFAECGLFALLPGDSLLFAVGMLTAMGLSEGDAPIIHYFGSKPLTLVFVCVALFCAAILGNLCGYWLGRLIGPPLFKPRDGLLGKAFDPKYVDKTHDFFEKYGSSALILARFVPFVRTFVTMIAGIGKMDLRKFMGFTAIGGALWIGIVTVAGYFLGSIPFIRNHIGSALIAIVFISLIPMIVGYLNEKRKAAKVTS